MLNRTIVDVAQISRRRFLRKVGVMGAGIPLAGGLIASACGGDS
jgi:hypothetical protein